MRVTREQLRSTAIVFVVWVLALLIYGSVGESDRQTMVDLTDGINKAEIMSAHVGRH